MPPHNRRRRRRAEDDGLAGLSEADRQAELVRRKGALSLAEAGLTVRTVNALENNNLLTLNDVLEQEGEDLLAIENFGGKTLKELYDVVVMQGLTPPRSWALYLPRS